MKLLLLNAFKGMKKKKVQMLAIVAIIFLSSTIYIAMNTAITRVENGYYAYLEDQNVEHFSFTPKINFKEISETDLKLLDDVTLLPEEKSTIEYFKTCYQAGCSKEINDYVTMIFYKYNKTVYLNLKNIEKVAEKYNFTYELQRSKTFKDENVYTKIIPYVDQKINVPYIVEGTMPSKAGEITILPGFAKANDIKINDYITVNEVKYKVVGLSYLSDHIYPLISLNVPIFTEKTNNIIIMSQEDYKALAFNEEVMYSARLNDGMDFNGRMEKSMQGENSDYILNKIAQDESIEFNFLNIARFIRTDAIQGDLEPNRVFTEAFLYLLLGIASFIVIIIVKKRIEDEKMQIGILKSLGYNSFLISVSYLIYPIIGVLIGSTLGYIVGLSVSPFLSTIYISFYNLPLQDIVVSASDLSKIILLPLILLSVISYITAFLMVRKKPLFLLKEGSNLKVNIFSRIVNKILTPFPFKTRFKYSLAFRSLGKLFVVSAVSFTSGLLIVLVLIGSNLFGSLLDQMFSSMNYDYIINYNTYMKDTDKNSDMVLSLSSDIIKINGIIDESEEKTTLTLQGVDEELKHIKVVDKDDKNLLLNLNKDNNIVIPAGVAETKEIKVGDTLTFSINNTEVTYKVSGLTEDFFTQGAYLNREKLSDLFGFESLSYNVKYTNDTKYDSLKNLDENERLVIANIFSFSDLKENIEGQVEVFNSIVYVVIGFSSFMALIIVLVVANIVVEENKKNISLMKVLGYKNKEISSIILRIYTPFIIFAYLISVPIMVKILESIVALISKDIDLFIPIEVSMIHVAFGLVGMLTAYFIGVSVSKRVLNKIPLAIALKREWVNGRKNNTNKS